MSDFSVNAPDSYPERYYQRGLDEAEYDKLSWDFLEEEYLDYVVDLDDEHHIVRGAE